MGKESQPEPGSMFDGDDGPPGCYGAVPRNDHEIPPENVIGINEIRCLLSVRRMARAYVATTGNPDPDPAA